MNLTMGSFKMSLTLKEFRELTKDLPEDTIIGTTIEYGNPISLRGVINEIHIVPKEHSYSKENYLTLTQHKGKELIVKKWIDKNTSKIIRSFK